MQQSRTGFVALLLAVTLSACSDDATGPDTVSVQVPTTGGVASLANGEAKVIVPAGALGTATAITIAQVESPPPTTGLVPGTAVQLGPSGMTFAKPVELAIKVNSSSVPAGAPLATLAVHRLNGTTWARVAGSTVDPQQMVVKAQLTSFSVYAVVFMGAPSEVVLAGDAQTGKIGEAVGVPPSVVVRTSTGAPLPGLKVTFAVTSGGGSLEGATTVTDEQGRASLGAWILGPNLGAQTVTATVEGYATPIVFTATAEHSMQSVAGTYRRTRLVLTEPGEAPFDLAQLPEVELEIVLNPNGTTTGRFFVPGSGEEGSGVNANLAGTWQLNGDKVTFSHSANSYIKELVYTVEGNTLTAAGTVAPSDPFHLDIVLTRQ